MHTAHTHPTFDLRLGEHAGASASRHGRLHTRQIIPQSLILLPAPPAQARAKELPTDQAPLRASPVYLAVAAEA